jgi:SWI/SNF-related matrix-associated actin-dependent regulator 1 of chromatin subfamily A
VTKLFAYQKVGVRMLGKPPAPKKPLWAILADDMGLGKTIQVLMAMKKYLKKKGPVLVICPATAKYTWEEQAAEHAKMNVVLLNGTKPDPDVVKGMKRRDKVVYVISYNCLTAWIEHLVAMEPVLIVPDECQRLKNPGAKWTKATMDRLRAPHMIFTGGTGGLEKTPADLWPSLVMLRQKNWPKLFRNLTKPTWSAQQRFLRKFTILRKTPWGMKPAGTRNMSILHKFLNKYLLIRRRMDDVWKDLPPVQRFKVPVDMTSKTKYDKAEASAILQMNMLGREFGKLKVKGISQQSMKAKAIAGNLLRETVKLKLPAVEDWIRQFMEESDEKLLVFGHHKFVVKGLQKKFGDAISVRVDGGVTGKKRQAAIARFNTDPTCRLFFGNWRAAGESWSCRSASTMVGAELYPNPAVLNQAERRIRGVKRGVKGKPTRYFYLIAKGTVEERLLRKIQQEQKTIDQAIDAGRTGGGIDLFEIVTGRRS